MPTTHLGAWPDTPERYSEVSYDLSASTAPPPVIIGGDGVSRDEVVAVARGRAKAEISAEATANMERARALVNRAGDSPDPVYGVSTGFGLLATTRIPPERRSDLQHALIRSHAAGMGDPVEVEVVRAMMLLRAGFERAPLEGASLRLSDREVSAWRERADRLTETAGVRRGAAIHSVRAVDQAAMRTVAEWARERETPLHLHLSRQPAENAACLAATGLTPTELA